MDWGVFVDWVASVFAYLVDFVMAALQWVLSTLVYVADFLYGLIVTVAKGVLALFGKVGDFFHGIWENVLKGPIAAIWNKLKALHDALLRRLAPVLKILRLIRFYYDKIFKTYIQPILNLLQRIRAVLAIFRVFHLKFAQKLDADILKIEGKIASGFLQVKQWINYALNWLDIIVEPGHFFHEGMYLASLLRDFGIIADAIRGLRSSVDELAAESDGATRNKILTPDGQHAAYRTAFSGKKTDSQTFIESQRKALDEPSWVGG